MIHIIVCIIITIDVCLISCKYRTSGHQTALLLILLELLYVPLKCAAWSFVADGSMRELAIRVDAGPR